MRKNVHVGRACQRIVAAIRTHTTSMSERRDIIERIARLPLLEADDLAFAGALNQMADNLESAVAGDGNILNSFKMMEREYKNASRRAQ